MAIGSADNDIIDCTDIAEFYCWPVFPSGSSPTHMARSTWSATMSTIAFPAKRAYLDTGRLVPHGRPGAMIEDQSRRRRPTFEFSSDWPHAHPLGATSSPRAHSICVHGDSPHAVALARAIRVQLAHEGIDWCPLLDVACVPLRRRAHPSIGLSAITGRWSSLERRLRKRLTLSCFALTQPCQQRRSKDSGSPYRPI